MGKLIFALSNAVVSGSRNLCKKCVGFSIYLNLLLLLVKAILHLIGRMLGRGSPR